MHRFRVLPIISGAIYAALGGLLVRAHALEPEAAVLRFSIAGRTMELSALAAGVGLLAVGGTLIALALLARAPRELPLGEARARYVDAATRLPLHYFAQGLREWLWNRFVARLWLQFALLVAAMGLLAEYLQR